MKKKNIAALFMAGAMCLGLLAGCSETSGEASGAGTAESKSVENGATDVTPFKLGGIGPLTGENAQYGIAAMNGAQIAVDEINALGGAIQFEFQAEDDVSVADTSVNAYNTLKDWGMQILVGPVTTTPAVSVSAEAYADRIFTLTPSASSTDVTAGKDNVFQMCFTDPNQGISGANYISENFSDAKIAIIYCNDDAYSQGIRDAFVTKIGSDAIVYEGTFTKETQTDFSVQVAGAQAAGADVVYLPIYYTPASVILKQASDIGYEPTFIGVDGMDGILDQEGFDTSLAEGVLLVTPFAATLTDDLTVSFVTEYESRYGQTPNQFAADGYDCVYAIYEALQAAGCTADMNAADICDALIATFTADSFSFTGLTGQDMTWSTAGEVTKAPMAFMIQDGIYVLPN